MRTSVVSAVVVALGVLVAAGPAAAADATKSKPFEQWTPAEITAAKAEANTRKITHLVACADPGNMPLSNDKREGFQNKIAEVIGRKLGATVSFFWRPYLERGLTRETFDNNECQVLLDLPADYASILTTVPVYRTGYVLAYRSDRGLDIKSLDDPVLKTLKIGVFQHSGAREALAERGIKAELDVQVIVADADLRPELQPWRQVQRVVDGELDAAAVWGPFAGWLKKQGAPLTVVPINRMDDTIPLEFSLAWGVQNTDVVLKFMLDRAFEEARAEIAQILEDYGVPLITCSNCVVAGNLPSHAILSEVRTAYEKRFLSDSGEVKLSDKASADQVVSKERLQSWLDQGADKNAELFNAISSGDIGRVRFLLSLKADPNARDNLGHRPLGLAASARKSEIMDVLIAAGADTEGADGDGMTALHHAINANHVPAIETLVRHKADLEHGDAKGYAPLDMALIDGKTFAAKALIDAGVALDRGTGPEKLTPLMVVATQLQPQQRLKQLSKGPTPLAIAEELIKRRADVNARSADGITALMIAAGHNNAPMIGLLAAAGAALDLRTPDGRTALDIATGAGNEAAVGALQLQLRKPRDARKDTGQGQ